METFGKYCLLFIISFLFAMWGLYSPVQYQYVIGTLAGAVITWICRLLKLWR
jgi:hypothetical protein